VGGPHLVYMGRLEERKGVQVLLRAWAEIATALPNAHLTIAGDGHLKKDLHQIVQNTSLPRVRFLSPPSHAEAPGLIASADFFMAPATGGESFGLVLIEAMSAGALPVAAANTGFATVLTGEGAALMVPPSDPKALASKVIKLARNPALCDRVRDWAKAHAARFDIASVGPEIVRIFEAARKSA